MTYVKQIHMYMNPRSGAPKAVDDFRSRKKAGITEWRTFLPPWKLVHLFINNNFHFLSLIRLNLKTNSFRERKFFLESSAGLDQY